MVQTQEDWYKKLLDEKANSSQLNDPQKPENNLSSDSKMAIWSELLWVVAYIASFLDGLFEQFKVDTQGVADRSNTGTAKWYEHESLTFQYTDDLIWNEDTYKHEYLEVDDPAAKEKRIISNVAIIYSGGEVRIKTAKKNTDGDLEPLTSDELKAFDSYWKVKKIAGTTLSVISLPADKLKLQMNIIYNPLVLAADGTSLVNPSISPVEEAIKEHISSLDFDGRLWVDRLEDSIQKAEGVVSVHIISSVAKHEGGNWVNFTQYHDPVAGYLVLDDVESVITYSNV